VASFSLETLWHHPGFCYEPGPHDNSRCVGKKPSPHIVEIVGRRGKGTYHICSELQVMKGQKLPALCPRGGP
jgi:hypothetical protein